MERAIDVGDLDLARVILVPSVEVVLAVAEAKTEEIAWTRPVAPLVLNQILQSGF